MEKPIGSRRLPYLRLQNVRLRGQLEEEHRHMRLLGKSKRGFLRVRQFCCKLEIYKDWMRPWKIPRPQIGSSNSEKMDVGCQGHQRLGSATEVRRQTASARLTEEKSIILCWCSMSSWCYIQNGFHMSYFLNNLSSLTPARIHRSRVNQFACSHMFFFRFSLGFLGRKPPKTTSSQALVKERQGRGLRFGFHKIGASCSGKISDNIFDT